MPKSKQIELEAETISIYQPGSQDATLQILEDIFG